MFPLLKGKGKLEAMPASGPSDIGVAILLSTVLSLYHASSWARATMPQSVLPQGEQVGHTLFLLRLAYGSSIFAFRVYSDVSIAVLSRMTMHRQATACNVHDPVLWDACF